jgi:hypothetical protein
MPHASEKKKPQRPPARRVLKTPNMSYVPHMSLPRLLAQYVTSRDLKQPMSNAVVPTHPDDNVDFSQQEEVHFGNMPRKKSQSEAEQNAYQGRCPCQNGSHQAWIKLQRRGIVCHQTCVALAKHTRYVSNEI